METDENVKALFEPDSVAVIGASAKEGKIGYEIISNVINYGFDGEVYPVNPKEDEIMGKKSYDSVLDIPGDVDMAVIVVPSDYVLNVVEECGKKGVKAAPIITSGFGEVGKDDLENEIVETANEYGMRILGPNVFGVAYPPENLNSTFGPEEIRSGGIALVSQSGALGIALMGWTILHKMGMSAIVSIGNKSDLDDQDFLKYFKYDDNTEVVILYIEGIDDGEKFMEAAKEAVKDKPIIAIKAGRSERGAQAASSHTGSLAGSDKIYDAAFKQSGVLRAKTVGEAFDWAQAFSNMPQPKGDNTVILTNGGGVGVMATDACEEHGINLYDNQEELDKFYNHMPDFGSAKNPVDLTGMATSEEYEGSVRAALNNDEYDSLIVLYCKTAQSDPRNIAETIADVYEEEDSDKPLTVSMVGGPEVAEAIEILKERGIPAYEEPEDAVDALSAMYEWEENKKKL